MLPGMEDRPTRSWSLDRTQATLGDVAVAFVAILVASLLHYKVLGLVAAIAICLVGMGGIELLQRRRPKLVAAVRIPDSLSGEPPDPVDVSSASTPEGTGRAVLPPSRLPVGRTPKQLVALTTTMTQLQVDQVIAPLLGNWMRVSGSVRSVEREALDRIIVSFADPDQWVYLLYFEGKSWKARLSVVQRGDHLDVMGQLSGVGSWGIRLQHCEIVD